MSKDQVPNKTWAGPGQYSSTWPQAGPRKDPGRTQTGSRRGPRQDPGRTQAGPRQDPGRTQAGPRQDPGRTQAGPRQDPGRTQARPRQRSGILAKTSTALVRHEISHLKQLLDRLIWDMAKTD
jgi:hypothetical protein